MLILIVSLQDAESDAHLSKGSESMLQYLLSLRDTIAHLRKDITRIYIVKSSKNDSVEMAWTSKSQVDRERIVLEALVRYATSGSAISEDFWQYCPDITKESMCVGAGEGFLNLLKHFLVNDPHGQVSVDFPVLKDPRVWRLWDIRDAVPDIKRPRGIQAYHNMVMVLRHYFLVGFTCEVLSILVCYSYSPLDLISLKLIRCLSVRYQDH